MLCAKFGWNWPSGSGEEVENVKSLQTDRQTDGQTDGQTDRQTTNDRWSEKLTWAFSSGELKITKDAEPTSNQPLVIMSRWAKWRWTNVTCQRLANNTANKMLTLAQKMAAVWALLRKLSILVNEDNFSDGRLLVTRFANLSDPGDLKMHIRLNEITVIYIHFCP